jgi:hypothetical protein
VDAREDAQTSGQVACIRRARCIVIAIGVARAGGILAISGVGVAGLTRCANHWGACAFAVRANVACRAGVRVVARRGIVGVGADTVRTRISCTIVVVVAVRIHSASRLNSLAQIGRTDFAFGAVSIRFAAFVDRRSGAYARRAGIAVGAVIAVIACRIVGDGGVSARAGQAGVIGAFIAVIRAGRPVRGIGVHAVCFRANFAGAVIAVIAMGVGDALNADVSAGLRAESLIAIFIAVAATLDSGVHSLRLAGVIDLACVRRADVAIIHSKPVARIRLQRTTRRKHNDAATERAEPTYCFETSHHL